MDEKLQEKKTQCVLNLASAGLLGVSKKILDLDIVTISGVH
jgi:hypothetical protein